MSHDDAGMRTIDDFDELVAEATVRRPLHVRFSDGPTADAVGTSRDTGANVEMPGLSVCLLSPEPWWTRSTEDWVARRLCKYLDLQTTSAIARAKQIYSERFFVAPQSGPERESG